MLFNTQPIKYIIAGLGNPGEKYLYNRHNVGFMCVDYISQKEKFNVNKIKFRSVCNDKNFNDSRCLFMKPQTYMNLSGESIREAAVYYKIPPENIIIIQDDINLAVGKLRIKRKGADGGHNGIKNIILCLGTDNFTRVKLGVGMPPPEIEMVNWVTGNFSKADHEAIFKNIENAYQALLLIIGGDIDKAMNLYN